MRREWPAGAREFAQSLAAVVTSLDGVDAARRAEGEPGYRDEIGKRLDVVGALALDPWGEADESAAAALAVREAGRAVLPWPLAHALAVPPGLRHEISGVHLVLSAGLDSNPEVAVLDHADLLAGQVAVDLRNGRPFAVASVGRRPAHLDPFGARVRMSGSDLAPRLSLGGPTVDAAGMRLLLDGFWVAGALTGAAALALRHARERHQFGRAIGRFGEIRTRIADLLLARDGLDELARYTWWLAHTRQAHPADLLALRVQMLESAHIVLTNAHQILGAMGLCEEHDLTVIDRHLQPVLRRPAGRLATTSLLAERIRTTGFDAIWPVAPAPEHLAPERPETAIM